MSLWRRALAHPYALLLYTVTFWSGNMIVGRLFREELPPMQLALGRWIVALMLTLPFAVKELRAAWPLIRAHWRILFVLGALGVGGYNTLAYLSLQTTTAVNAALLNAFIPIATLLLAAWWLKEPITRRRLVGITASLAGVAVVVSAGDPARLLALQITPGDAWMLAAVLTWAAYTVLLRRRPPGLSPMVQLTVFILVGIVVLWPLVAFEVAVQERHIVWSWPALAAILYTGIFPAFLGYVFYNAAVAKVGPAPSSQFINLMPVITPLLSYLFVGEPPQSYHAVGLALVFLGIYVANRR